MSSQRRPAKAQLRRSLSEQLRDSTAKAWDLLWRNVRERRLAGQSPPRRGRPGGRPGTRPGPSGAEGSRSRGMSGGTISAASPEPGEPAASARRDGELRQERGRAAGRSRAQAGAGRRQSNPPARAGSTRPGLLAPALGVAAEPPRRSVSEAPSEHLRNEEGCPCLREAGSPASLISFQSLTNQVGCS